jgi:hypothetical protein
MITAVGAAVVAVIALASALAVAHQNARSAREIERLKAELNRTSAIEAAERSTRDEARRRLNAEVEPLILKIANAADDASDRIIELVDRRRWQEYRLARESHSAWMLSRSSRLIGTAQALLEPLALYTLLTEKITLVDQSFDPRIGEVYELMRAAYRNHSRDAELADLEPRIDYAPITPGWRELREQDPAKYWWQGLTRPHLASAIEVVIHRDANRPVTSDEFRSRYVNLYEAAELEGRGKSLGLFCNPLYGFTIDTRPVYWRLLLSQLLIYRRAAQRARLTSALPLSTQFTFAQRDLAELQRLNGVSDQALETALSVAETHIARIHP